MPPIEPTRTAANRRNRLRALTVPALACAGVAVWLVASVAASHLRAVGREREIVVAQSGGEALASALGGFRGLVADFLWLRALQMEEMGRYDETALLCSLILDLQPRFASVWTFLAWNQAYNLAFESTTPADRWRWIRSGLDLLETEGVRRVPHSYALFWELGQMYFFRMSYRGADPMFRYYQEQLAPVPDWCAKGYEFVDEGLWSDRGVRYRLYKMAAGPGVVRLGACRGAGGYPTRARRMYVVAVRPRDAVVRVAGSGGAVAPVSLEAGARLYSDAPDAVARSELHPIRPNTREPSIPPALADSVLIPTVDSENGLDEGHPLEIELARRADLWVGWYPDETRNFHIARRWLAEARGKSDAPEMMVARLRAHALVEAREWEQAYEEWLELVRTRPPGDDVTPEVFKSFLLQAVFERQRSGDVEGAERWNERLKAEFPPWDMTPQQTADWLTRELGW